MQMSISAFTDGGLITSVQVGADLKKAVLYMLKEHENMGIYCCPACQIIERAINMQTVFCSECLGDMERLDQAIKN